MYEGKFPYKRYQRTLDFLKTHFETSETILDLGVQNPFTEVMTKNGYSIKNMNTGSLIGY